MDTVVQVDMVDRLLVTLVALVVEATALQQLVKETEFFLVAIQACTVVVVILHLLAQQECVISNTMDRDYEH
jgi:hypothetical protein